MMQKDAGLRRGQEDAALRLHESRTITNALAMQLRTAILDGALAPGTRLRQAEVAKRYDVSTTPVREAFALLQKEGLVTREENKGVVVFEPTLDDLRESYLIRIPLEALATAQAVPNLTAADFKSMRRSIEEMRLLDPVDEADPRSRANNLFHSTLYLAAGLPRLYAMIEELRSASSAYLRLFGVFHRDLSDSGKGHESVLAACEDRDASSASRRMVEHLELTVNVVADGLTRSSPEAGLDAHRLLDSLSLVLRDAGATTAEEKNS